MPLPVLGFLRRPDTTYRSSTLPSLSHNPASLALRLRPPLSNQLVAGAGNGQLPERGAAPLGATAVATDDRIRVHGSRVGQAQSGAGGFRETARSDRGAPPRGDGLGVH